MTPGGWAVIATHSDDARTWLRNYHGSIDATALLLAFDAGQKMALTDAGNDFLQMADDGIETRANRAVARVLLERAKRIGKAFHQYAPTRPDASESFLTLKEKP